MDSNYTVVREMVDVVGAGIMNMHEFNIVDNGKSALMITFSSQIMDESRSGGQAVWIGVGGCLVASQIQSTRFQVEMARYCGDLEGKTLPFTWRDSTFRANTTQGLFQIIGRPL